ncbi:MAG TPA: hypothetical protein VK796_12145 [Cytophaga sp.]|jgi:hypothetical protein|nr:hypothetical protein [Cytophaga sp.]
MTLEDLKNILVPNKDSLWHSETEAERIYILRDLGGDDRKLTGILEVHENIDLNYDIEIFIMDNSFKCLDFKNPIDSKFCDLTLSQDKNHIFIRTENSPTILYHLRRYI